MLIGGPPACAMKLGRPSDAVSDAAEAVALAVVVQRVWRGYMGRLRGSEVRMEMAEFIAMIRMEEAAADEEEVGRRIEADGAARRH